MTIQRFPRRRGRPRKNPVEKKEVQPARTKAYANYTEQDWEREYNPAPYEEELEEFNLEGWVHSRRRARAGRSMLPGQEVRVALLSMRSQEEGAPDYIGLTVSNEVLAALGVDHSCRAKFYYNEDNTRQILVVFKNKKEPGVLIKKLKHTTYIRFTLPKEMHITERSVSAPYKYKLYKNAILIDLNKPL